MAMVVEVVDALVAEGHTVVSSVAEIEELLRQHRSGEKLPGEFYVIVGSLEVSEAEAMKAAIDELHSEYSVACPDSPEAQTTVEHMARLHQQLVDTESHISSLLKLADGFKTRLKEVADDEVAKLEYEAEKRHRRLVPSQVEQHVLRKEKEARVRLIQAKAESFKTLRSMTQRANRRYEVGPALKAEIKKVHLEVIQLVAFCLSGARGIDWIITALENLNEAVLPNLRSFAVEFGAPDPAPAPAPVL